MKNAFSLIEILIVFAIIASLAAILFPVLARARQNALRASCQFNLKQVGLASLLYAQDYDEMLLPQARQVEGVVVAAWPSILEPYAYSKNVFICPSVSEPQPPNLEPSAFANTMLLNLNATGRSAFEGRSLVEISNSQFIIFVDGEGKGASAIDALDNMVAYDGTNASFGMPSTAHVAGFSNVVFIDGHVKSLPCEQFWKAGSPFWHTRIETEATIESEL